MNATSAREQAEVIVRDAGMHSNPGLKTKVLIDGIIAALEEKDQDCQEKQQTIAWYAKCLAEASKEVIAAQKERDALKAALEAERKGWPQEQPFTDEPLDRQVILLNRQVGILKAEVERLRQLADKQSGYLKLYEDSDSLVGHDDVDELKEERDEARRLLREAVFLLREVHETDLKAVDQAVALGVDAIDMRLINKCGEWLKNPDLAWVMGEGGEVSIHDLLSNFTPEEGGGE